MYRITAGIDDESFVIYADEPMEVADILTYFQEHQIPIISVTEDFFFPDLYEFKKYINESIKEQNLKDMAKEDIKRNLENL